MAKVARSLLGEQLTLKTFSMISVPAMRDAAHRMGAGTLTVNQLIFNYHDKRRFYKSYRRRMYK